MRIQPRMIRFETSDARELVRSVGRVNAELHGGAGVAEALAAKPKARHRDAFARVVGAAGRAGDRRQRMRAAAEALAREFIVFSAEDWRRVAAALDIPKPDESLEELVRTNVVYQPKPGFYRTV